MNRLTKDDIKEMGMLELSHNQVFVENHEAWYRDYFMEITVRDLAQAMFARNGIECPSENDEFDQYMLELLQDGYETLDGMIALYYNALWSMAEIREKLKDYEDTGLEPEEIKGLGKWIDELRKELREYKDLEEQGRLIKLRCKVGDMVYKLEDYGEWQDNPHTFIPIKCQVELIFLGDDNKVYCDLVSIDDLFQLGDKFEEIPINEIYLSKETAEKASEGIK